MFIRLASSKWHLNLHQNKGERDCHQAFDIIILPMTQSEQIYDPFLELLVITITSDGK